MTGRNLDQLLRRTGRAVLLTSIGAGLMLAIAALLAALLVVVVVDAVFALPPTGLLVLNGVLVGVLLVMIAQVGQLGWQNRYRPRWVARLLEAGAQIRDSRLINAVDLAGVTGGGGSIAFSESLRQRAVDRGEEAAAGLSPKLVIDRQRLLRAGGMLLAVVVVVGLTWTMVPRMFGAVLPRLASPWADHPPYTALEFDVTIEPEVVLFGQPATVHVQLAGPRLPASASIVFVDEQPHPRLPLMRLPSPNASATGAAEAYLLQIERAERSRVFYIDTPAGRSRRHELTVKPVPLFESVHVTYTYPDYTGWSPATEPLPARGIRALIGTSVRLEIRSNVPLGEGRVVRFSDAAAGSSQAITAIRPGANDRLTGTAELQVESDGRYAMELVGADGTPGLQPLMIDVTAVADGRPAVDIVDPTQRLFTPPDRPVQVRMVVRDDIGLGRAELHRGINGWGPVMIDVPLQRSAPTRATAEAIFDLPALGLEPGDVITYFAAVYDNRPERPGFAESSVNTIEVISVEDWVAHMRTRRDAQDVAEELAEWNRRLAELQGQRNEIASKLQALQDKIDAGQNLTPEEQEQMKTLAGELEAFAKAAADLADDLRKAADEREIYDFEKGLHEQMRQLADALQQPQAAASELAGAMAEARPGANGETAPLKGLSPLVQKFMKEPGPLTPEARAEREKTEKDLEKLAAANEMLTAAETLRQIIVMQRDLTERMAAFRHVEQLEAMQQLRAAALAEEQAVLKGDLEAVQKRLKGLSEQHGELLPKMSANAAVMAQKLESMQVVRDQDAAARLGGAGRGRLAHVSAESAATKLESLLSDCNSSGQDMGEDLDGCLSLPSESWANAAAQLRSGMRPGIGLRGGGSGIGTSGSMALASIAGAGRDSEGDSASQRSGRNQRSRGRAGGGSDDADDPDAAQQLDPDATTDRRQGSGGIPGVPDKWRDEAEAYFRRLADESNE